MPPALKEKDDRKGKRVGPYKFGGVIGKGGMALVRRGVHETLERDVAIKELLPHALSDRDAVSRFKREALALATFRHQNIVAVYDLVEKNGTSFLILEYVDGPTLLDLLKQGPLPPIVVAVIGAQLAAALEHAHFHRIVHRDLKPANVMLTRSGDVKLMDFGIAKDEDLARLTKAGMAVGTPSYMSPEQVTGAAIDQRTDIYSLGVVLYECLAGVRAFSGGSAGEVFSRVRDGRFKTLTRVAADVPPALARIVKRAMQTKPESRYFEAAAMRRDLEAFIAAALKSSSAGLLVSFLRNRGKISEDEALAHVSARDLSKMKTLDAHRVPTSEELSLSFARGKGVRWALGTLLVAGAGAAAWFHAQWWPQLWTLLQR